MIWKYAFAMDRTLVRASTPLFMLTVESRESGRWAWRLDVNRSILQTGRADSMDAAQEAAETAYREFLRREFSALSAPDRQFVAGEVAA